MGKTSAGVVLATILAFGVAQAQTNAASGTGETLSLTVLARLAVEDVPGHELVQSTGLDRFVTPDRIAGVSFENAQMRTHNQSDLVSGSGLVRGYGVWEAPSGEKVFLVYGYRIPPRTELTGATVPFEGTFEWIGGTGALRSLRGNGTITGQMAPGNRATYRWNGTYRTLESP